MKKTLTEVMAFGKMTSRNRIFQHKRPLSDDHAFTGPAPMIASPTHSRKVHAGFQTPALG
jgi:hypothetical protein